MKKKNPDQPLILDDCKVVRFKENRIVRMLLDEASKNGYDLNKLAIDCYDSNKDDWKQFYQLIGYSVSGFCDLSRVTEAEKQRQEKRCEDFIKEKEL